MKAKREYYEGGSVPWLLSGEVAQRDITAAISFITKAGLENSSAKIFSPDTVLVAMYGATAGQVGILRIDSATNQAVCGIYPNENVVPEFLYYTLLHKKDDLVAKATGNAQPNISQIKIRDTEICLPSVVEQKRIVALLDEAFTGLDAAIANATKNLASASELFDSYLSSVFSQKTDEWRVVKLENLCERITKGSSPNWQGINYVDSPGILFVTSENVRKNEMVFSKTKYVDESFNKKDSKSILVKGDVLTNIVGASIGRTAVFDRYDLANINQAVCLMRCKPDLISNHFLCYLLNSPVLLEILHDNEVDNARANLSLGFFKSLEISVPPLEAQELIVAEVKVFAAEVKALELIYQQKLNSLAELKQSLLQKAFTGQLSAKAIREDVAA